jgi:hypothetical protein
MKDSKNYSENFQSELSIEKIDTIWKNFREAGNSIEGRIAKPVANDRGRTSRR